MSGLYLQSIGLNEYSYHKEEALSILDKCKENRIIVLGGEAYHVKDGVITITGDSWYFEPQSLSLIENVEASIKHAKHYICNYRPEVDATTSIMFSIVLNDPYFLLKREKTIQTKVSAEFYEMATLYGNSFLSDDQLTLNELVITLKQLKDDLKKDTNLAKMVIDNHMFSDNYIVSLLACDLAYKLEYRKNEALNILKQHAENNSVGDLKLIAKSIITSYK